MVIRMNVIAEGFAFLEGPRWREDSLYFSDMHSEAVFRWCEGKGVEKVVEVRERPSGLGWDPQGRLLIVSMRNRSLLRWDGSQLETVADLSSIATFDTNDMVVDARGGAYIGNFGSSIEGEGTVFPDPAKLAYVSPDGQARVVAEDLLFPNGSVITPDGKTLIVGETFAGRMTAFDIRSDGSLENRRIWAEMTGRAPDGCCLDDEGAVWVASPTTNDFVRVREGGEILDRIEVDRMAIACTLGGPDGRSLFLLTSKTTESAEARRAKSARIEEHRVQVPSGNSP
ncbi:MAG: SMP-30/gluconolactonase/LRE family protein [Candidatus Binatia bacterium]|nr:SMP-30/gluconolactonase/LRE family protein [Candidatus Binatia bacterium]HAC80535.1 hypothetical protein [Deltaproteobacteria bacterium]